MSLLNKTYECIALMLSQNNNIERCLIWTLALVRGKDNLTHMIIQRTLRDLSDSLQIVSREPSKRGLLASLLASQVDKSILSTALPQITFS